MGDINKRFNEELQQQIEGTLPKGHVYQLGMPGEILLGAGMPDSHIELKAEILAYKSSKDYGHPFELSDIKDLPKAINYPIAVFAYGDKTKAMNVITGIEKDEKNFLVGIALNPEVSHEKLNIHSIRTIFPKDTLEWKNWIDQEKALYLDKEKVLRLLSNHRNPVDVNNNPNTINIINNFAKSKG
jgi:hypothetical protein